MLACESVGMRWLRIVPGGVLCLVAAFVLLTRWSVLFANNPAYLIAIGFSLAVGVALVITGLRATTPPIAGWGRRILRGSGAFFGVAIAATLLWARPFPATDRALDALRSDSDVTVADGRTETRFTPGSASGAGFALYPGARVDPRAYAVLARAIAEKGHEVVVLKCPFDIAFLCSAPDLAADQTWAVGGHSLGGVAASAFAAAGDSSADGLVLWASFPASDVSEADILVASVSGTEDGLATPADIAASKPDLPASTVFTPVSGANHADFGDYGPQRGDGTATITREDAQAQIVAASVALLDSLG